MIFDEDNDKIGKEYYSVSVSNSLDWIKDDYIAILCINPLAKLKDDEILSSALFLKLGMTEERFIVYDRVSGLEKLLNDLFQEYSVDTNGRYLKIGGVKFPNYLQMEDETRKIFIDESADLILPEFFNITTEINEGPYEDEKFYIIHKHNTCIVFDLGANIDMWTAIAAAKKNVHVYAFEPVKKTFKILEKVCGIYSNVTLAPYAVTDSSGTVCMTDSVNLDQNKITTAKNGVMIPSISLDEYVEKEGIDHVDFIKADIEGSERDMLIGSKNILRKYAPRLSICTYHRDDDPEVLESIVRSINPAYKVRHSYKKLFAWVE